MFFGVVFVLYFFSFVGGYSVNTYPTRDYPLKRSARRTFALSQKSRRYNRSCVRTEALTGMIFVTAQTELSGIVWT